MSFDHMLKKVGTSGCYQLILLIVVTLSKLSPNSLNVMPVLVAGKMDYKCKIPQNKSTDFIIIAGKCQLTYNDTLTGEIYHEECLQWEFSQKEYYSTIRSAYNLVCDREFLAPLSTTFYFVGFMIGCTLYGYISDTYGRLVAAILSVINIAVFGTATAGAPNYWSFCLFRVLSGIGSAGQTASFFTLAAEIVEPKRRTLWLILAQNGCSVGICLFAIIGYFIRNHIHLQLIITVPSGLLLLSYFVIYESPRWLYGTGQIKKADKILRQIAKRNNIEIDENFSLQETFDSNIKVVASTNKTRFIEVFRYPGLRRATLLVWCNWVVCSMGYYAMIFMLSGLGGNVYLNLALLAMVEIPARLLGLLLMSKCGRKHSIVVSFSLGGIACLLCALFLSQPSLQGAVIVVAICGHSFFTVSLDLTWIYSAEVFPTVIRNMGIGIGSTCARIGSMIAPQLGLLKIFWTPLPFVILSFFPIMAAISSWFLPETKDRILAESFEQGELLAQGKTLPVTINPELEISEDLAIA